MKDFELGNEPNGRAMRRPRQRVSNRAHRTVLGAPAGDATTQDGGNVKQAFDGGYISESAGGTLGVRSLSNTSL
ncbi:MAG: hypothetical protein JST54_04780 [Deltaproteobacteria bacterium]|nr:hypothetical protein [Deltaproteobacteria bacterium]